ncbi:MAG: DUF4178 domain-containing protein [Turneriella sp.]|nr:DUF4178 domain-containing protein [Leptospiraceae bacterium]MCX7632135.1 DUF4178 domain-containing protein [Turneriella sp.]
MSVQAEEALREVGKVAALVEDGSPLRLGATGSIGGKTFKIIGRIQYRHPVGFWNEWFLVVNDDEEDAWLGEASGQYYFTRLKKDAELPEDLDPQKLQAGEAVPISGQKFFVRDIQTTKVVSGEGELPFPFETGYEATVVDCVSSDGDFATLDFSEEKPLVFIGKPVNFRELNLVHVRSVYGFKATDAEPVTT